MAEQLRGCGWRHVGGVYLVGDYLEVPCDRLPFPLPICPVCHSGVKIGRGLVEVNPERLFGLHRYCSDEHKPCFVCQPQSEIGFLMRVSEKFYTPESFLAEGKRMGFSKRVSENHIPRKFELGKTVVYLAHINACVENEPTEIQTELKVNPTEVAPRLLEATKVKRVMGIFTAFIPQRVEKIYWQSALDEMPKSERERLEKRGITCVPVPDNDERFR